MRRIICLILISSFVLASVSFAFAGDYEQSQIASNTAITNSYLSSWNSYILYLGSINNYVSNLVNIKSDTSVIAALLRGLESYISNIDSSLIYGAKGVAEYSSLINDNLNTFFSSSVRPLNWRVPSRDDLFGSVSLSTIRDSAYPLLYDTTYDTSTLNYWHAITNRRYLPANYAEWANLLNTNIVNVASLIASPYVRYKTQYFNSDTFTLEAVSAGSLFDYFDVSVNDIVKNVGRLSYFFVDDDELQAKKDNKDVISGVVSGFLSPGESASLSGSNVLEFKGSFDAVQNGFGSSASATDSFSVLSSGSETYSWFSQSTADDLDSVGSGSTLRALGSDTPALDQYYQDVLFGIHFFD